MNTKNRFRFSLVLTASIFASIALTGCADSNGGPRRLPAALARDGAVEEVLPERRVTEVVKLTNTLADGTVNISVQTNVLVLPAVYYTNQVASAALNTGLNVAQGVANVSGIPWAGTAVQIIGWGSAALLGWFNFIQRRKLHAAGGTIGMLEGVATELVSNVSTARDIIKAVAPSKEPELINRIQQSQIAAGPAVSSKIATLV